MEEARLDDRAVVHARVGALAVAIGPYGVSDTELGVGLVLEGPGGVGLLLGCQSLIALGVGGPEVGEVVAGAVDAAPAGGQGEVGSAGAGAAKVELELDSRGVGFDQLKGYGEVGRAGGGVEGGEAGLGGGFGGRIARSGRGGGRDRRDRAV